MSELYPLRFIPLFRRYLWGGRRLATVLNKAIGDGEDYAESWELVDRGDDQSVVSEGRLAGTTLHQLVTDHGPALLGRHHPQSRFPLLFKFLDACKTLSVQVHPDDLRAAQLVPPDLGKTEAWVVLAAEPESWIYAGLKRGFDRAAFAREVMRGTSELCLHRFQPCVGDCLFIPAGTVHALGAGLLVAEIQQASDTTYRLFDWNRTGADGRPRTLHVEAGLEAIDYQRGPAAPQVPQPTDNPRLEVLVACDQFVLQRWSGDDGDQFGGDQRCHLLIVLEGAVQVASDPAERPLVRGETLLLPAACGPTDVQPLEASTLLAIHLP